MAETKQVITLWPDGAPGTADWRQAEQDTHALPPFDIRVVRNVTKPTLTVFLPDPAVATGTGVIVCPGGAFHFLAIDHEGYEVARWLAAHGVAAFVLKYRVVPTAVDDGEFQRQMAETMADRDKMRELMKEIADYGVADAQQALRLVQAQAADWRLDQKRIGILGFSAGGIVTCGVAVADNAEAKPAFAAPIYGAPREGIAVPADAPPLFIAVADDDDWASRASLGLSSAWKTAGRSVEMHIYAQGGHGFGMRQMGLPSDHWIERFVEWLQAQGF